MICFHHEQLTGKVFESKADKCCSILKSHCHNSKAHRVINLEIAKILKEKGFNDILPGQKLHRQCVTEYEKNSGISEYLIQSARELKQRK